MGAPLAMFSPVEVLVVLFVALVWIAGLALAAFLVYVLVRRAARNGARDAQKKTPPEHRS